jgi:hypothetical protein
MVSECLDASCADARIMRFMHVVKHTPHRKWALHETNNNYILIFAIFHPKYVYQFRICFLLSSA